MNNVAKSFDILATSLSVLHNDSSTRLFLADLAKFLDTSAKLFFACRKNAKHISKFLFAKVIEICLKQI